MKLLINRVIVGILVVTLAGAAAFAKSKRATLAFVSDFSINGTLVTS